MGVLLEALVDAEPRFQERERDRILRVRLVTRLCAMLSGLGRARLGAIVLATLAIAALMTRPNADSIVSRRILWELLP
jgi:hypothetical protein